MKKFEEIKTETLKSLADTVRRQKEIIGYPQVSDFDKKVAQGVIDIANKQIEHIDEVTAMYIASRVNGFLNVLRELYNSHSSQFSHNFQEFADEYLIGDKIPNAAMDFCHEFGIDMNDLAYFEGVFDERAADNFRRVVNINMGTNIPLSGEVEKAETEWKVAKMNSRGEDEAYVNFTEKQRDAGILYNGGVCHLLDDDEHYQQAKARLADDKKM